MNTEITILIADDHPLVRKGLREMIEAESPFKVIEEAADGLSAFEQIERARPDIAILDINMPKLTGFELARKVQQERIEVDIVFLTMYKDRQMFNEALDLGARGYVLKNSALTDIIDCLKAVRAGEHYISPPLTSLLIERKRRVDSLIVGKPALGDLTPTELRILKLISESRMSKEIASQLCISNKTVENHRTNICAKLDLHGNNALLKFALEHRSELSGPVFGE
jgi:DNA-binding NarL/FixJ family response regulator